MHTHADACSRARADAGLRAHAGTHAQADRRGGLFALVAALVRAAPSVWAGIAEHAHAHARARHITPRRTRAHALRAQV
jgi:hypothetical protein